MFLHTKRLILRNYLDNDLDALFALRNDAEVARFQGWTMPYSLENAEDLISSTRDMHAPKQGVWLQIALALKTTDELIGDIGCFVKKEDARQATIGYSLASRYWGMGYAFEAVRGWLGYLFDDLDMHRVVADCDTENTASYRLLERLGFRREAHYVENFSVNGEYKSEYHYGLLQREWREMSGRQMPVETGQA